MADTTDRLSQAEACKLLADVLKHVTTLSVGLLVAIGAVIERYFTIAVWRWLIPTSIVFLLLSIVSSVLALLFLVLTSWREPAQGPDKRYEGIVDKTYITCLITSFTTFLSAIISIGIFIGRNVW
jgi:hypothetical protein